MWENAAGQPKELHFDVVTDETQEMSVTATEHPVEDGANISDHIRRELNRVALEVFVSNTPILDVNGRGARVQSVPITIEKYKAPLAPTPGAVFNAVGSAISSLFAGKEEYAASVLRFRDDFDAVAETLATLEQIRDDGSLVTVTMPSRDYENMLLETVAVNRNARTGTGATFTLAFRELKKVEVSIVNAPVPTEIRGQIKKPKGVKAPLPVSDGGLAPAPLKSVLSGARDMLKDFDARELVGALFTGG
jgi:hypothetical protein